MTLPAILISLLLHLGSGAALTPAETNTAPFADAAPAFTYEWDDSLCGEDYCWIAIGSADSGQLVIDSNAGTVVLP